MIKHAVKYIITARILKSLLNNFLLFFFTVHKNEWKEHTF